MLFVTNDANCSSYTHHIKDHNQHLLVDFGKGKKEITQAELASRINKKRTFISMVENDGKNITLKTLFDIVERGLGGRLKIEVQI
ncbi:helix-turn-helix domain-containing protein [Xylanibacter caecicola]|uniref:helix-turn-helix domain-containing protein n=1 Tax=Xylanibacter caecicola TaxID=2736294 RepID=UPI002591D09B|nr:helix-turn-helix transcriptional regulator [Xylanibacter caecicola]